MSNIQPLPKPSEDRPSGQDLTGPEFLHYKSEWQMLAQRLFMLGHDKTDKHRTSVQEMLDRPAPLARADHGGSYLQQVRNEFRGTEHRDEVISSQNLYIDSPYAVIELQMWNEEHPYGINEDTERDILYLAFHYKKTIPEELWDETLSYAVVTSAKEVISIVMVDEERQTNPKRASEISKVLKDLADDPQIHGHFLDPEVAKLEVAKLNQLN